MNLRPDASEEDVPHVSEHPLRESLVQKPRLQPLGVLLMCRRSEAWHKADVRERREFDLSDPQVLEDWEQKLEGRFYRIYGYGEGEREPWEFFSLLEFDDLEAWQGLEAKLEESGFSVFFEWEVLAFGRRAG
ncbi:MAG: hypothetical protein QGI83_09225 [Candidatus Latescibacteria bacterium]|jgi:hypothetical protein|nr:hypothetical protein [Candidatus Latescibacterota bacterium]